MFGYDGETFETIEQFLEYLSRKFGSMYDANLTSLYEWGVDLDGNHWFVNGVKQIGSKGEEFAELGFNDPRSVLESFDEDPVKFSADSFKQLQELKQTKQFTSNGTTYTNNSIPLGGSGGGGGESGGSVLTATRPTVSPNGTVFNNTGVMTAERDPDNPLKWLGTLRTLGGLTLPAWTAAAAPIIGVGLGVGLYEANPEFWEKLSRELLPYCYDDNGTPKMPVSIDKDGNVHTSKHALEKLREIFIEEGVYDTSYEPNPDTYPSGTEISLTPVSFLDAVKLSVDDVKLLIDNGQLSSLPTYFGVTAEQAKTMYDVLLNAVMSHSELYTNIPVNFIGVRTNGYIDFGYVPSNKVIAGAVDSGMGVNRISSITGGYYFSTVEGYSAQAINLATGSFGGSGALYNVTIREYNYSTSIIVGSGTGRGISLTLPKAGSAMSISGTLATSYTSKIFGLYNYPFVLNLLGGAGVEGAIPEEGAVYPTDTTQSLEDLYPTWYNNGIDVISNPVADTFEEGVERWLPLVLSKTNNSNDTNDTASTETQTEAQTGTNTDDAQINQLADAITSLTEALTDAGILPSDPTIPTDPSGETPTPTPPVITGAGSDLIAIYNPTKAQIQAFNQFLWSLDPSNLANWKKVFVNPIEAVIALQMIYVTPITGETRNIKCGYIETDVPSKIVTNQYVDIDCGSVEVSEYFHNVWDYIGTHIEIYLPFVGIVPLNVSDIMDSTIRLRYRVDVYTGTCLAQITVYKGNSFGTLYTFPGNCSVQLPITSGQFAGLWGALIAASATAVTAGFAGASIGAALGAGADVAGNSILHSGGIQMQRSGGLGSNAGAMGIRTPYLIITRKVPLDAHLYQTQYGFPANKTVILGSLSGYTRVKDVHLSGVPCTDDELEQIESLLKDGVIIN